MNALYTVLLGNPFLDTPLNTECQTRFKMWWRLVGSAVEYAAAQHTAVAFPDDASSWNEDCPPHVIAFKDLFLRQEEEDEESASLADMLGALSEKWPNMTTFRAGEVTVMINDRSEFAASAQANQILRDVLFPEAPPSLIATARSVGKRLKRHIGEPVMRDGKTLVLKAPHPDAGKTALGYFVAVMADGAF